MNFKRPNQLSAADQSTKPPSTAAVMDPSIFEMGTSVSVNDEMRRSVAAEVTEIEAACSKLTAGINLESKTAAELGKAQQHVDTESIELLRGATEATEAIHIDEEVLRGLATTFESELGNVIDRHTDTRLANVVPPSPSLAAHTTFTLPNFNDSKQAEIESYETACRETTERTQALKEQTKEHMRQSRAIRDSIKTNGLQLALANAKYHNSISQTDIEDEIKRETELSVKLDALIPLVTDLERTVPKKEQELQAKMQANAIKEREWENMHAALVNRKRTDEQERHKIEQDIALLDQKLEELERAANEAKELIAKREKEEERLQRERFERHEIAKADEKLGTEVASAKLALNHVQSNLADEKMLAEKLAEMVASNDAIDVAETEAELEEKQADQKRLETLLEQDTSQVNGEFREQVEKREKERSELECVCASLAEENSIKAAALLDLERQADGEMGEYEEELQQVERRFLQEVDVGLSLQARIEQQIRSLQEEDDKAEDALRQLVRKAKVARYAARAITSTEEKEAIVANIA